MKTTPTTVKFKFRHFGTVRVPDFSEHFLSKDLIKIVAREAFDATGENWEQAVSKFLQWIRVDKELFEAIGTPLIHGAVKNAVYDIGRTTRKEFFRADAAAGQEKTAACMVEYVRFKMNYPLRNGLRLGDATRQELDAEIQFFTSQSATMAFKARWFKLIRNKLKSDDVRVKDVLTENDLNKFEKQADGPS